MSILQKVSIILNNLTDQDEQIEIIKIQVLTGKVWQYLDPSEDTVLALEELMVPMLTQINVAKMTVIELTLNKYEQYKIVQQDYKQKCN